MSEEQTGVTKKSFGDNNGHSTKRLKLSENARASFEGAYDVSVLNEKRTQKAVFLQGKFPENPEADAVIILEQKPFDVSPKALSGLLSVETELSVDMNNDIYSTYNAIPARGICGLKATLIYPASKKHINKYKKQDIFAITETGEDYQQITLPYLEKQFSNNVFNIQWVYNILDHKQESERIIFEDCDPETGFVLLPDMKWDAKDAKSLYVIAIPHKRGIKSVRELTGKHLPLLENIELKALGAIKQKFGLDRKSLRLYFHYQPSYYHLHVHITHIELDIPGTSVLRAHLLYDVIENIKLKSDYYQQKTFSFTLVQNDPLLEELCTNRNI
ncbi:unnamed protein product [Clavelina lepadiformis]|uniref:m7GpppX diphosphatase n=1 Tax=Clavelina lepadiformis TaxID=159417 RepID=A0ABP0EZL8_CLALP